MKPTLKRRIERRLDKAESTIARLYQGRAFWAFLAFLALLDAFIFVTILTSKRP